MTTSFVAYNDESGCEGFTFLTGENGMVYYLPWQRCSAANVFEPVEAVAAPPLATSIPPELSTKPPELSTKPPELGTSEVVIDPSYLDWDAIPEQLKQELTELGLRVSEAGRVPPALLRQTLHQLCSGRYLGLRVLAQILQRDPDDLRKRTLSQMVKDGQLRTAYPTMKDPRQAYTAGTPVNNDKK